MVPMRKFVFIGLLALFSVKLVAAQEPPRLVVGIMVGQMRYDYLARYAHRFGDDGFKKLINEGMSFSEVNYGHLYTQAPISQATVATGAWPSEHGISALRWYNQLEGKKYYCVADKNAYTVGSPTKRGSRSPWLMKSTTFSDQLKLATQWKARVYTVGFRDYDAILPGGSFADAAYWYDVLEGNWVTSSFYQRSLPEWLRQFNQQNHPDSLLNYKWNLTHDLGTYTASRSDRNEYEPGFGRNQNGFPYRLRWLNRNETDFEIFGYTPLADGQTRLLATQLVESEKLGRDAIPDFLAVSFSASDHIDDLFGPYAVEMEDYFIRLDKQIAALLKSLEKQVGKEHLLVYLTAAHGASPSPVYLRQMGANADIFTHRSTVVLLKSYLRAIYGDGNWIPYYNGQQLYLNQMLIEDKGLKLVDVQRKTVEFLTQLYGVAHAVAGTDLRGQAFSHGLLRKMQQSWHPNRSGDVCINLNPNWVEGGQEVVHTGYRYDTHVPLIWYGGQIPHGKRAQPLTPNSIAPTICHILGTELPPAANAAPIQEVVDAYNK